MASENIPKQVSRQQPKSNRANCPGIDHRFRYYRDSLSKSRSVSKPPMYPADCRGGFQMDKMRYSGRQLGIWTKLRSLSRSCMQKSTDGGVRCQQKDSFRDSSY